MKGSKRIERLIEKEQAEQRQHEEKAQVAIGYVRVSTEEQAIHGYGLESQEKAIRAFAESQGYVLLDVIEDPGVSGATQPGKRPGFSQVVERSEAKQFTVLLVWKIDRLARSIIHAVTTTNELRERHGVVLRSVTEPIDTATPMGQTLFAILAGMAQQERHTITERTLAGKKAKASKGGFAGATAPYGYRTDGKGHLVIHESEAATVRRMWAMRKDGSTLKQIADRLNADGTPTRRNGTWHPATVRYILDNPKYRGQLEYYFRAHTVPAHILSDGQHAALVSEQGG